MLINTVSQKFGHKITTNFGESGTGTGKRDSMEGQVLTGQVDALKLETSETAGLVVAGKHFGVESGREDLDVERIQFDFIC